MRQGGAGIISPGVSPVAAVADRGSGETNPKGVQHLNPGRIPGFKGRIPGFKGRIPPANQKNPNGVQHQPMIETWHPVGVLGWGV